jgi:predicted dehydrogenase
MKVHKIGIIMNGVTGRMGTNQHLIRSIKAIIDQGGVKLSDSEVIMPDPVLVGRSESKLKALAARTGVSRVSTNLDEELAKADNQIYFDATLTGQRPIGVRKAIAAKKHIYCEKPTATTSAEALALAREVTAAGLKNGVVQDKLWLPGLVKLKYLIDTGFFGKILSVRGEFGYWVFTGEYEQLQRPSWNYRKEDDGGIIVDMVCHWQYVIQNLFGDIKSLTCLGATHIPTRWDEAAKPYKCTADDAAYATFELKNGTICHFNSSWAVRVDRDDLLTLQVDGTHGSAVAGPPRLQSAIPRRHAALRLESRHRQPDQLQGRLGARPEPARLRQRVQDPVGTFPQARRHRLAVPVEFVRRRERRATRRSRPR